MNKGDVVMIHKEERRGRVSSVLKHIYRMGERNKTDFTLAAQLLMLSV